MNQIFDKLFPVDAPDAPLWNEEHYVYLVHLREYLRDSKVSAMPVGPTQEDAHNYIVLSHRLDAQIELVDNLLANLKHQLQAQDEQS